MTIIGKYRTLYGIEYDSYLLVQKMKLFVSKKLRGCVSVLKKLLKLLLVFLMMFPVLDTPWSADAAEVASSDLKEVSYSEDMKGNLDLGFPKASLEDMEGNLDFDFEEELEVEDLDFPSFEDTNLHTIARPEIKRQFTEGELAALSAEFEDITALNTEFFGSGLTVSRANLRETPSGSGKLIRQIPSGTNITIDYLTPNGSWARVRVGNTAGYVSRNSVMLAGAFATTTKITWLRNNIGDNLGGTIVSRGEDVTVFHRSSGWVFAVAENGFGWVRAGDLVEHDIVGVNVAAAPLRKGPGASHDRIRTVAVGNSMTILNLSTNGNWLRVKVGKQTGWMSAKNIRASATSAIVTASTATLRHGPATSHTSLWNQKRHDQLSVIGKTRNGNWSLVHVGSFTKAWVKTSSIRDVRMPATVTSSSTTLRRDARSGAKSIRSLKRNTNMTVIGGLKDSRNRTWLHVRTGGRNGWVLESSTRFIGQPGRVRSNKTAAFRRGPSSSAKRIRSLRSGTRFQVLARHGNWMYVQVRNSSDRGWVHSTQALQASFNGRLRWQERSFHVAPTLNSKRIRTLSANTQVKVLAYHGNWTRVRVGNTTGWVLFMTLK